MTPSVDTLMALADRYRDLKVGEGTAQTRKALRAALTEALAQPYNADPSCTTVQLAEMILSDCGCSSNNTLLVSRVANRIDAHMQAVQPVRGPLTNQQIDDIMHPLTTNTPWNWQVFARAIEAAHVIGGDK